MTFGRMSAVLLGSVVLVTAGGVGGAVAGGYVTSAQIQDETVQSVDVRDDSIRSRDLTDGTVRWRDMAPWVQDAARHGAKPAGGVSGLELINVPRVVPTSANYALEANCPAGKRVTGGGVDIPTTTQADLLSSVALDDDTWRVVVSNDMPDHKMTVQAICVTAD